MFGGDPVPSYKDNEFPAYMRSEEDLRNFLKGRSKGKTLFACVAGLSRSGYLKNKLRKLILMLKDRLRINYSRHR